MSVKPIEGVLTASMPVVRRRRRPHALRAAVLLSGLAALCDPSVVLADLFDGSPGKLSRGHSEWDEDCSECHESKIPDMSGDKCLDCHTHAPLAKRIAARKGFHGHTTVRKADCKACHVEHKGRDESSVKWSVVGGEGKRFPHERTGWPLRGAHADAKCRECHTGKWPVSHRTKYLGLASECMVCHLEDSPHRLSRPAEFSCKRCHTESKWDKADPGRDFDHNLDTRFKLLFKHADQTCKECHGAKLVFGDLARETGCKRCHSKESPHKNMFQKFDCEKCHNARGWKDITRFNHSKETRFPLVGEHILALRKCSECHLDGVMKKPGTACKSCHEDVHKERFNKYACEECHKSFTFKARNWFNHARTGYKLTGAHKSATCRKCHRGPDATEFERFKSRKCMDCHTHVKAHEEEPEFLAKPCLECHMGGGIIRLKYDPHEGSPFHEMGGHAKVDCDECHESRGYTGLTRECAKCHAEDDIHKGALGTKCETCHGVPLKWAAKKFVHNIHATYKIEGLHEPVKCEKCHSDMKRFKPLGARCIDCHRDEEPHAGRLGEDCEACHNVFTRTHYKHSASETFPIVSPERHAAIDCGECHKDRRFRPTPAQCNECHGDPHGGRYGKSCDSCHRSVDWLLAEPVHTVGTFRLAGTHDEVPCGRCHTATSGALAGTGRLCITCHRDDDLHRNALGAECGECHSQWSWMPSTWKHVGTGFALTGAHRFTACDKCHAGGVYGPIPNDCIVCHDDDRLRVAGTHVARPNCEICHFTTAWRPFRMVF